MIPVEQADTASQSRNKFLSTQNSTLYVLFPQKHSLPMKPHEAKRKKKNNKRRQREKKKKKLVRISKILRGNTLYHSYQTTESGNSTHPPQKIP